MKKFMFFGLVAFAIFAIATGSALANGGGSVSWGGHGSGNLPCDGAHWVLTGVNDANSATLYVNGSSYSMHHSGNGSWSADSSGVISGGVSASASWTGGHPHNVSLQLSHCNGTPPPPPTPTPIPPVLGCTDKNADNYNPDATQDDGSCTYDQPTPTPLPPVLGCTDKNANNYNSDATQDDGSCTYDQPTPTPIPACGTEGQPACPETPTAPPPPPHHHHNPTPQPTGGESGPGFPWMPIVVVGLLATGLIGFAVSRKQA